MNVESIDIFFPFFPLKKVKHDLFPTSLLFFRRVSHDKGSGKPIGEVIDFFWRIEFQLRGSPHVHSLWWIKDAPDLDTKAGSQSAPEFIDRYISVQVPDEGCGKDELKSTILRVQQHKHTTTCQKTSKKKKECRFDFPDLCRVKHA